MISINPYLNFKGNTEEAFLFYKSVFGGEFAMVQRFRDTPESGQVSEGDKDKLMHIALPMGKSNVLMGTDAVGPMADSLKPGNNISLTVGTTSSGEADKIYQGLSAGGNAFMPMAKVFWGAYFGMLTDKFGITWMISYDENFQSQM